MLNPRVRHEHKDVCDPRRSSPTCSLYVNSGELGPEADSRESGQRVWGRKASGFDEKLYRFQSGELWEAMVPRGSSLLRPMLHPIRFFSIFF